MAAHTTQTGRRRELVLPPASVRGQVSALADQIAEVESLRRQVVDARARMNEAKQAVSVAETEDRQRLADHARGRLKQRPKPRKPRAESDLQAAEERVSVLEVACADAEAELILAIEGHREDLAGRLDNELERRRDQLRSEAGKLAGSEAEFRDLRCLRSWLREPTRSWTAGKFGLQTELAGPNREPITIHHALAMIEAALAEPRPKQEKVQRLKPTAAGAARVPPPR